MTVETTIQKMFDRYPDMYSTRKECLDHLLCTIGNGYKWKWGQLVYLDMCEPGYDENEEKRLNEADYAKGPRPAACQSAENVERRKKHDALLVRAGILKDPSRHEWYPLSRRYSRLFTAPEDVRSDWKAAIEECKRMMEEDGVDWRAAK